LNWKDRREAVFLFPKTATYFDDLLNAAMAAAPSLGIELVPARIE
jgi:hypothetical protein